jgi:hypothetical protein
VEAQLATGFLTTDPGWVHRLDVKYGDADPMDTHTGILWPIKEGE